MIRMKLYARLYSFRMLDEQTIFFIYLKWKENEARGEQDVGKRERESQQRFNDDFFENDNGTINVALRAINIHIIMIFPLKSFDLIRKAFE